MQVLAILKEIKNIYTQHNQTVPNAIQNKLNEFSNDSHSDNDIVFVDDIASIISIDGDYNEYESDDGYTLDDEFLYQAIYEVLLSYKNGEFFQPVCLDSLLHIVLANNATSYMNFTEKLIAHTELQQKHNLTWNLQDIFNTFNAVDLTEENFPYIAQLRSAIASKINMLTLQAIQDGVSHKFIQNLIFVPPVLDHLKASAQQDPQALLGLIQITSAGYSYRANHFWIRALEQSIHKALHNIINTLEEASPKIIADFKILLDYLNASYNPLSFEKKLFKSAIAQLLQQYATDSDVLDRLEINGSYGCSVSFETTKAILFCKRSIQMISGTSDNVESITRRSRQRFTMNT